MKDRNKETAHDFIYLLVIIQVNSFMTEPLSYRNQSIDLDWFLYDNGLRHERVKVIFLVQQVKSS